MYRGGDIIMRKFLFLLTLVSLLFHSFVIKVNALEYLPYWYSTTNKVAGYTAESMDYLLFSVNGDTCPMTATELDDIITTGINGWDSALEIDFVHDQSASLGTAIKVGCVSRETATLLGFSTNAIAVTIMAQTTTLVGRYRNPDDESTESIYNQANYGSVEGNPFGGSTIFLIWDTDGDNQTSDFSAEHWYSIAAHEFGHAIGYFGHSNMGSSQLMYYTDLFFILTGLYAPQEYDLDQMLLYYVNE
jgi:hypothetical protein